MIEFENTPFSQVKKAAEAIREMNDQESIFLQMVNSNVCEITKDGEYWMANND